jgi:hypothetical protein
MWQILLTALSVASPAFAFMLSIFGVDTKGPSLLQLGIVYAIACPITYILARVFVCRRIPVLTPADREEDVNHVED